MSGDSGAGPYFFLSYAHTPRHDFDTGYDPDQWVERLFTDLCRHVTVLSGLNRNAPPGFMDRQLNSGSDWPRRLAESISSCRVFVPLYSRHYFDSEHCGREWTAFSQRILRHHARGSARVDRIVPALWVPVPHDDLPEVARSIQFGHSGLGTSYLEHGFYGIMKLRRFRDAYQMAVYRLARRIVEVGQAAMLTPSDPPPDYESLSNAFGQLDPHRADGLSIRISVIAPDISHLPEDRLPYHYGYTPLEWNPYRPVLGRPLAEHVAEVVRQHGFRVEFGTSEEDAGDFFGDAARTSPGIVLVDAWATVSDRSLKQLRRLGEAGRPWLTVLAPWNPDDAQTMDARSRLRANLMSILQNKAAEGRPTQLSIAMDIETLPQLTKAIPEVAQTAVIQHRLRSPAHPPQGFPSLEFPRLQGVPFPLGDDDTEARR
ncbi:TIR-like protein FxsC [Sphaerisporangium corydalis]|uniref:TIR-like protein FxsC n=1 Tax=Sphaerisporangium corydalis TaxID=1441875 RepID=A0ABV9EA40_9ACTN|nr:TIR-like protein FxsC [Sphaerisporangium corydalis]